MIKVDAQREFNDPVLNCAERVGDVLKGIGVGVVFIVGGAAAIVVAPIVSLVAIPFFALKALPQWMNHRERYNRTLMTDEFTRAEFGRIEGQDYTRWDGKKVELKESISADQFHKERGLYLHGSKGNDFMIHPEKVVTAFNKNEDYAWLHLEGRRRDAEDLLNSDLDMLRIFAKALIPFVGVFWALGSERLFGGASSMECAGCMGEDSEGKHWSWKEAISFHLKAYVSKSRA